MADRTDSRAGLAGAARSSDWPRRRRTATCRRSPCPTLQPVPVRPGRGRRCPRGREWGLILLAPYVVVFLVFVLYPVGYGLWLARHPASYAEALRRPDLPPVGLQHASSSSSSASTSRWSSHCSCRASSSGAHVDQVAVAAVHPALGGAVDPDDPVDPLHAESGVGAHQFGDLPAHRGRRTQLAQRPDARARRWRCSCTSGSRCRSGR